MAILASDVLTETRVLLNDPTGAIYVTTPMLGVVNKAYKELQTKLTALSISTSKEVTASPVVITAGTIKLSDGAGLPADMLYPMFLRERASGSSDQWADMDEEDFEPSIIPANKKLLFWAWREEEIKFPAASTDREVQIKYVKSLGSITATTSPIAILNSVQWLSQRSAAIAALSLGSNPSRAAALMSDIGSIWDDLKATLVKRKQGIPVRRRRTRYRSPW